MRLLKISLFCVLTMCFVTSTATAVEFSAIGSTNISVDPGGSFTLDIALTNTSLTANNGVVGTITGLIGSNGTLTVTSGVSAAFHFVGFCSPTACFAGINSNPNAFFDDTDLSMSGAYTPGDDSVVIISALALTDTSLDGALDPGLDGGITVPSDRDVTITLLAPETAGVYSLVVGGRYSQAGNQEIVNTATVTVNVPEPSAIAASVASLGTVFAMVGIRRRARFD